MFFLAFFSLINFICLSSTRVIELKPIVVELENEIRNFIPVLQQRSNEINLLMRKNEINGTKSKILAEVDAIPLNIKKIIDCLEFLGRHFEILIETLKTEILKINTGKPTTKFYVPIADIAPYLKIATNVTTDFKNAKNYIATFVNIFKNYVHPQLITDNSINSGLYVQTGFIQIFNTTVYLCGNVFKDLGNLLVNASLQSMARMANKPKETKISRQTMVYLNNFMLSVGKRLQDRGSYMLSFVSKQNLFPISSNTDFFNLKELFAQSHQRMLVTKNRLPIKIANLNKIQKKLSHIKRKS